MAGQVAETVALRFVKEVTYGVAPTTGWKELRYTSESLKPAVETQESEEIIATRQVAGDTRVSASGGGAINVEWHYGTYDDFLEIALGGTWTTNVLQVGTTMGSVSIEKKMSDTNQFMLFTGAQCNGFSLTAQAKSRVTGSFNFLSKSPSFSGVQTHTPGNPSAVNSNVLWNTIDHIQATNEGGGALANVVGFSISVNNGLRAQPQLAASIANSVFGVAAGAFTLTGELQAYFLNATLANKFMNYTESSLDVTVGESAAKKYQFLISKLNYTDLEVVAGGRGQDVLVRMPFKAKIDATATTLRITRTP
jgi:hypothetical protein